VKVIVPVTVVDASIVAAYVSVDTLAAFVPVRLATGAATEVNVALEVTAVPFGSVNTNVVAIVPAPVDAVVLRMRFTVIGVPAEPGVIPVPATVLAADVVSVIDQRVATLAALDGTTDRSPNPNDATATSAMRLIVVFVDICFLSNSQDQEFPALGLGEKGLLICHERALFERSRVKVVMVSTLGACEKRLRRF
jgi:hypothetical protein